jgi:hypothetical protein
MLTRAASSKAVPTRSQARPSSRSPLHVSCAAAGSSARAAPSPPPKNAGSSSSSLRHLVDVALPHARARLRPFAEADAVLTRLIADPLLTLATTTKTTDDGRGSSHGNGNGDSADANALSATRSAAEAVDAAVDVALALAFSSTAANEEEQQEAAAAAAVVAGATAAAAIDAGDPAVAAAAAASAVAAAAAADAADAAEAARLFLMRCLWGVNRLAYVWYGAPLEETYGNERCPWLLALRERIESTWQDWEERQMAAAAAASADDDALLPPPAAAASSAPSSSSPLLSRYRALDVAATERLLLSRLERDRYRPSAPSDGSPLSPDLVALRDRLTPEGYAHLLAAGAHDGLTEASRQSRVCAGTGHPAASALFRILIDEYGGARLEKKHSTFYEAAMRACGILGEGEAEGEEKGEEGKNKGAAAARADDAERYLDLAPWESLAASNHSFLISERRRHILRYCGALAAFELYGPWAYEAYAAAADRADRAENGGQGEGGAFGGYWRLHVKEDARHGPQAVREVALPLARLYGDGGAWEVALGYDQEGWFAARATRAVRRDIERCGGLDAAAFE